MVSEFFSALSLFLEGYGFYTRPFRATVGSGDCDGVYVYNVMGLVASLVLSGSGLGVYSLHIDELVDVSDPGSFFEVVRLIGGEKCHVP